MVAQERINVAEIVGRKNNCEVNFFSMYFIRTKEEIHLSFKNSEKLRTLALNISVVIIFRFLTCIGTVSFFSQRFSKHGL